DLVLRRKWATAFYYAATYSLGILIWLFWLKVFRPEFTEQAVAWFTFPSILSCVLRLVDLVNFCSWNHPLMFILPVCAIWYFKLLPRFQKLLLISIATNFLWYLNFPYIQGHGWGFRYFTPSLCTIVLTLPFIAHLLEEAGFKKIIYQLAVWGSAVVILVQIPLASVTAYQLSKPFADANQYLDEQEAEFLIIPSSQVWYSVDLVRNGPLVFRQPYRLSDMSLTPESTDRLLESGRGRLVDPQELTALGLSHWDQPQQNEGEKDNGSASTSE
ncbi:MAG: hypothetical protein AAFY98_12140, partial [Verrucomicrobiota bacterium]